MLEHVPLSACRLQLTLQLRHTLLPCGRCLGAAPAKPGNAGLEGLPLDLEALLSVAPGRLRTIAWSVIDAHPLSIQRPCRHPEQAHLGRVQLRAQRGLRSARLASLVRSTGLLRLHLFCQNSPVALQGCALTPHVSQQRLVPAVHCRGCLALGGELLACLQQPARSELATVT